MKPVSRNSMIRSRGDHKNTILNGCILLFQLLFLSTLLLSSPISATTMVRNANPVRNYAIVEVPTLFMNVTSSGWTGQQSIPFQPTTGGQALPISPNADFSLDVPIMLPHVDDDISGCGRPWNTTNEFGQSFNASGAFVLIQQSTCTSSTYLMAQASGAAGIIVYGCPGEKPYNCVTKLHELVISTVMSVPLLAIATADGEAMVAFLLAAKSAQGKFTSAPLPINTLMVRLKSTGTLVPEERAAIVAIMAESTMSPSQSLPDVLPLWNHAALVNDSTLDPCRPRWKGLWCEANHVVMISVWYQSWWNSNTSYLPKEFGAFPHLRYLNIQSNALTGAIPDEWCALTDLRSLWLDGQFRPPGIPSLPNCMDAWLKLEELRVVKLNMTSLPLSLSNSVALRKLVISRNQLTSVPDISSLIHLEEFDCSSNQISVLPAPNILAPLQIYSAGNNLLNGTFPVDFFDGFTSLQIVDVNTNQFTGELPTLQGCTSLIILDFSSQRVVQTSQDNNYLYTVWGDRRITVRRGFFGGMPDSWQQLKNLRELYLQENLLTTPMYAPLMQSLEYIDVSYNLLASSDDPADAANAAGLLVDTLTSPSQISIRASGNVDISGQLRRGNFQFISTMRALYLSRCSITAIPKELWVGTMTTYDFSYNNISRDYISSFPVGNPLFTALLLNLRGNPYYSFDTLPVWAYPDTTRLQGQGVNYTCAPLKASVAPLMTILVDPEFYQYQYCDCASGTFGAPPLCSHIPSSARLNPFALISSAEIGPDFPNLIDQTNPWGDIYTMVIAEGDSDNSPPDNDTDDSAEYVQCFSDGMYGDNRLTLGMATSWVIDLSNVFKDCPQAFSAAGVTPPDNLEEHKLNSSHSSISDLWSPVKMITIRIHLAAGEFVEFDDLLNVFEGDSDLKGARILSMRGSDPKPNQTWSDYTITPDYIRMNNDSISYLNDPRLIEVQVFSAVATVQFTSRSTSGLHFYATYSYDFECPSGYFWDTDATPAQCRINYPHFHVNPTIRIVVYSVASFAFAWVSFNLVILMIRWDSVVYKAASRPFMLLILFLLLSMPFGALLYATPPDVGTASGSAICLGRAWLTSLPVVGILGVILAKTRRLDAIFSSKQLKSKHHTDMDIWKVVGIVCSIQIILLVAFSSVPLSKPLLHLGNGSLSDKLVTTCSAEPGLVYWFAAQILLILAVMIPAGYLGFKTRDVPSQFNESTHIQNALLLLLFFGCVIIPLDIFIQGIPEAAMLLQGLGQSFLCIVLTAIIFGPKLYYVTITKTKHKSHAHPYSQSLKTDLTALQPHPDLPVLEQELPSIFRPGGKYAHLVPPGGFGGSNSKNPLQSVVVQGAGPAASHVTVASHTPTMQPSFLYQDSTPIPPPNSIISALLKSVSPPTHSNPPPQPTLPTIVDNNDVTPPTVTPTSGSTTATTPQSPGENNVATVTQAMPSQAASTSSSSPTVAVPTPANATAALPPATPTPSFNDVFLMFQQIHLDVQTSINRALHAIYCAEVFIGLKKNEVIQTNDIVAKIQMELNYLQQLTLEGVSQEDLIKIFQYRLQQLKPPQPAPDMYSSLLPVSIVNSNAPPGPNIAIHQRQPPPPQQQHQPMQLYQPQPVYAMDQSSHPPSRAVHLHVPPVEVQAGLGSIELANLQHPGLEHYPMDSPSDHSRSPSFSHSPSPSPSPNQFPTTMPNVSSFILDK